MFYPIYLCICVSLITSNTNHYGKVEEVIDNIKKCIMYKLDFWITLLLILSSLATPSKNLFHLPDGRSSRSATLP